MNDREHQIYRTQQARQFVQRQRIAQFEVEVVGSIRVELRPGDMVRALSPVEVDQFNVRSPDMVADRARGVQRDSTLWRGTAKENGKIKMRVLLHDIGYRADMRSMTTS